MINLSNEFKLKYVDELKGKGVIKSKSVERAFREVYRHQFIERYYQANKEGKFEYGGKSYSRKDFTLSDIKSLKAVYSDRAFLTKISPPSSTSQPTLIADMLEKLELGKGMKILEIGAGTGYNAALMREIVGNKGTVTTMDIQEDVANQTRRILKDTGYPDIEVILDDGANGFPRNAPYDRIIATVGCPDISSAWSDQLCKEGFMLIPLQQGSEGNEPLVKIYYKSEEKQVGEFVGWSGFMSIQGKLSIKQERSFKEVSNLLNEKRAFTQPFPPLEKEEILSFSLFVAIKDRRHFISQWKPGLWDKGQGAVLLDEGEIHLYGKEPPYQDFKMLFSRWEKLGKPKLTDYEIEFVPRSETPSFSEGANIWVVDRASSREVIKLN